MTTKMKEEEEEEKNGERRARGGSTAGIIEVSPFAYGAQRTLVE